MLGFDHRDRHREIVALGELVEQLALHVRAGEVVQLLALLIADQALQLVEALQPERFGEILVNLGLARGLHRLYRHGERRLLAL